MRVLFVVAPLLASLVIVPAALAEPYIGLYLTGVPSSEHDTKTDRTLLDTGATERFTTKDTKFKGSVVYGGLVGYRFLPFLAAEIDAYHLNPGPKGQTQTATGPTIGPLQVTIKSGDLDLTILALQLVGSHGLMRNTQHPDGQLHLYGGAGLAIIFASIDTQVTSPNATLPLRDSTTQLGPQVKGGARWFFTKNLAAFVEGRYAHAELEFTDTGVSNAGSPVRLKSESDLNLPLVLVGVSWFFR